MATSHIRSHTLSRRSGISLLARLHAFVELARSRRALSKLDARQLEDIGISRAEAQEEASRKPWDAPANWTC